MGNLDFLDLCVHSNPHRRKEELVGIVWAIWKKRCELTHMNCSAKAKTKQLSCKHVDWALHMIDEYRRVCSRKGTHKIDSRWTKIVEASRQNNHDLIVMCDASFYPNDGRAAAGIIILDSNGTLVDWKSSRIHNCSNPLEAELEAILLGLKMVDVWQERKISILVDCSEAIAALNESNIILSRGGYTLKLIKGRLRSFEKWEAVHINRELNEAAHFLAKCAMTSTGSRDWISSMVLEIVRNLKSLP